MGWGLAKGPFSPYVHCEICYRISTRLEREQQQKLELFLVLRTCKIDANTDVRAKKLYPFKGAVSRDFLAFFYFMNQSHLGP